MRSWATATRSRWPARDRLKSSTACTTVGFTSSANSDCGDRSLIAELISLRPEVSVVVL